MYTGIETPMFYTGLNTGRTGQTSQFWTIPAGTEKHLFFFFKFLNFLFLNFCKGRMVTYLH